MGATSNTWAARTAGIAVAAILAIAALPASAQANASAPSARYGVKVQHPGPSVRPAGNTLTVRSNGTQGVVSPKPTVYLVFWGKQWSSDPAGVAPDMQKFFKGLFGTADTWGTIMNQYCEGVPAGTSNCGTSGTHIKHPTVTPLAGVWFDNTKAEPTSATAAQLAAETVAAALHFGNNSQAKNLNSQYVILSPTHTHPDGFPASGFCGYHAFTHSTTTGNVAWTNLPYVPDLGAGACTTLVGGRLLDGIESTETHEYAEVLTDFWPSRGWNGGGGEIGDECIQLDARLTLSTGTFDVQGLWSNKKNKCTTTG
jgi:hypothetical protein